jgi:hypothetical protein
VRCTAERGFKSARGERRGTVVKMWMRLGLGVHARSVIGQEMQQRERVGCSNKREMARYSGGGRRGTWKMCA